MEKIEKNLYFLLGAVSGFALFGMMMLAFLDVVLRKAGAPLTGSVELTELLMVVLIFAGLPLVTLRGEHVGFELVDKYLGGALKTASVRAMHAVCALCFAYMAYLMWHFALRMMNDNLLTSALGVPRGPFAMVMCVLLAITAVLHLALLAQSKEKMTGSTL